MLTVFGSINLDLVAQTPSLPQPGETLHGSGYFEAPGGKGANQALAARRAGAVTRMVSAVGEDANAAAATRLLREAGVDMAAVKTVAGPTGVAIILVDDRGENVIVVVSGANGAIAPAHGAALDIGAGDTLLVQLEAPPASVRAALERARDAGARRIMNAAPALPEAASLAQLVDVLIVNETEAAAIHQGEATGDPDALAAALLRQTGADVVLTLGAAGAVMASEAGLTRAAALPVKAVDAVGAGDAFCGHFAAALDAGLDAETALRRGCAAGSLACRASGAQASIPTAADVDAALRG